MDRACTENAGHLLGSSHHRPANARQPIWPRDMEAVDPECVRARVMPKSHLGWAAGAARLALAPTNDPQLVVLLFDRNSASIAQAEPRL